jgi:hypothetical protein
MMKGRLFLIGTIILLAPCLFSYEAFTQAKGTAAYEGMFGK